jgi:hypothetical protein
MSVGPAYRAYDASLDRLVAISIDRARREVCVAREWLPWPGRECWPYATQALAQFELILRERRVPYVVRHPDFVALHLYTLLVWEPAGLRAVEVYYDNRGFLRDSRGREVRASGLDSAARFRLAQLDVYSCLGLVTERPDRVDVECIAPPYEAARAQWAIERARLCVAGAQDLARLGDVIRRYEAELAACRQELEELRRAAAGAVPAAPGAPARR